MFEGATTIEIIIFGVAMLGIVIYIIMGIRLLVVRRRLDKQVPAEFVQGIGGEYGKGPLDHGYWRLRVRYTYDGQTYESVTLDFVNRKNYPSSSQIAVWIDSRKPSVCCYKK